jgi:hypothetical protein
MGGFTETIYGYRYVVYLVLVVIMVLFLCDWCNRNSRQYSLRVKQGLNDLVKEASRTSTLAKHNENALLCLMQNSEALGYMKAARLIAPEHDLETLTGGVPVPEVEREIRAQQGECAKKLIRRCSDIVPTSRLAELAGLYPYAADESPLPTPPSSNSSNNG